MTVVFVWALLLTMCLRPCFFFRNHGRGHDEEILFVFGHGWGVGGTMGKVIIHVGGTRCVTSSTDHMMNIRARITLTVGFIRGYIFKFLFYV